MLFNKRIEPCCAYCSRGVRLSVTEVGCMKRGVVDAGGSCRSFRYDPLKREPAGASDRPLKGFSEEDFKL